MSGSIRIITDTLWSYYLQLLIVRHLTDPPPKLVVVGQSVIPSLVCVNNNSSGRLPMLLLALENC